MVNKFSDFVEETDLDTRKFEGNKVKIDDFLNKNLKFTGSKIFPSKQKIGRECLMIEFYHEGEAHIIFTGASNLLKLFKKYKSMMPFEAQIITQDGFYTLK